MEKHELAPEKSSNFLTYTLLVVIVLQGFFNTYLLTGNSVSLPDSTGIDSFGVKKALLELEYDKVGGKENYDLISKATLIQMQDQIPQIKQFVESNGGATQNNIPTETTGDQTMDATRVQKILSTSTLEGNTQANIVVIEYSDMECPYCIKQYSQTKLRESLLAQYGDKVAFAFKNSRGVNHPGTEAKALGALCAKKVGGNDAYIKFYHAIMDGTTQSTVYSVSALPDIAKKIGIDIKKWQSCYNAKETSSEFVAETQEAQEFGLRGTPGSLILNTKTGKYTTVEGAYPMSNFIQKIDALMN